MQKRYFIYSFFFFIVVFSQSSNAQTPVRFPLSQNYPNCFPEGIPMGNSSTIIEYTLPKDGLVSIYLYDITGRLVKQLVNEQKPMGRHRTTIDSRNLASGIYIYSLKVNDININKKLVILK